MLQLQTATDDVTN